MHEIAFADAARPARCVILKLGLLDYSIGHELLLFRERNPLALYTPESFKELPMAVQIQSLLQAVCICERNWSDNQKPIKWLRLWAWLNRKTDYLAEIEKFQAYRNAVGDFPTVRMPKYGGKGDFHYFGAPEAARLVNYISQFHPCSEPFDFPLGLARMLYSAHSESQGAIWIENYHDYQVKQAAAAFDAAHPENTLAIGPDAVQAAAEKWNREHPDCPVPLVYEPKNRN